MNDFFTPINTLLMLGSLQGIILAFILIFKQRGKKTANRILAGILFYISLAIILHSLSHSRILPFLTTHTVFIGIASVIISPLLYFYVVALTSYQFKFSIKDGFHFVPFLICILLGILFLFSELDFLKFKFIGAHFFHDTISIISLSVYAIYIVLANIRLLGYSNTIKANFSYVKRVNLIWLRILILMMTILLVFAAVMELFFNIVNWDYIWLASCVIIYFISYFGLVQPVVFSGPYIEKGIIIGSKNKKYSRSSLSAEQAKLYLKRLQSAMDEEKRYLRSDLNLSKLADELGISIHHLSQIINERIKTNFYDFVNSQRIEEAKKRLRDPRSGHLNIAAIGYDVGFNSISAFNAAFKKFTGFTPSQYKNQGSSG